MNGKHRSPLPTNRVLVRDTNSSSHKRKKIKRDTTNDRSPLDFGSPATRIRKKSAIVTCSSPQKKKARRDTSPIAKLCLNDKFSNSSNFLMSRHQKVRKIKPVTINQLTTFSANTAGSIDATVRTC